MNKHTIYSHFDYKILNFKSQYFFTDFKKICFCGFKPIGARFFRTIIRTLPGVLSSEKSFENKSHYNNKLEHPQYTRPRIWHNKKVPEVLLSGNHKENFKLGKTE